MTPTTPRSILPPVTPIPGLVVRHAYDLLTPEELRELLKNLEQMAQDRRRAYASAAWIPLP